VFLFGDLAIFQVQENAHAKAQRAQRVEDRAGTVAVGSSAGLQLMSSKQTPNQMIRMSDGYNAYGTAGDQ
jgi:hypothetical protein